MKLEIVKAQATANDFVMLEDLDDSIHLGDDAVRFLFDRHLGIGADGLIRVTADALGRIFMDYRNADGSVAEMCGNGARCTAKYCFDRGILTGTHAVISTRGGAKPVTVHPGPNGRVGHVEVDMGRATLVPADIPVGSVADSLRVPVYVAATGSTLQVAAIGMGNPHAVVFVEDIANAPVRSIGPAVETHPIFPRGTNVEFVAISSSNQISMRVWERGVGETLSCGTGACAAVVAGVELMGIDNDCHVDVPGGRLHVSYGDTIRLTGPAVEVFSTVVDVDTRVLPSTGLS